MLLDGKANLEELFAELESMLLDSTIESQIDTELLRVLGASLISVLLWWHGSS